MVSQRHERMDDFVVVVFVLWAKKSAGIMDDLWVDAVRTRPGGRDLNPEHHRKASILRNSSPERIASSCQLESQSGKHISQDISKLYSPTRPTRSSTRSLTRCSSTNNGNIKPSPSSFQLLLKQIKNYAANKTTWLFLLLNIFVPLLRTYRNWNESVRSARKFFEFLNFFTFFLLTFWTCLLDLDIV